MLHEIDEIGVYCGPGALMAVTGKRLPEVRAAINKARGKPAHIGVCGLQRKFLLQAISELGMDYYVFPESCLPERFNTLEKLVKDHNWCLPFLTYIVNVTGHYVAVHDGKVVDNQIRFGCPIEEHPSRRKKVKALIMVKEKK